MSRIFISCLFLTLAQFCVRAQGTSESSQDQLFEEDQGKLIISGFLDGRLGVRTQNDPNEKDLSLGEARLQLETEKELGLFTFNVVSDFLFDPVLDIYEVDLDRGEGVIDLRQANLIFTPFRFMDVKIGRQILTWGTGDLLFINDLFAKDWNSFLIGRDEEYLKAPSDAIKTSMFFDAVSINLIYSPKFGADRFIDGKRVSFFDRSTNDFRGREASLDADRPNDWFKDDEWAMRMYRSIGTYEAALYYYSGYWKSPAGFDGPSGTATFPKLQVFGASVRGPLSSGIANIETGYYRSESGADTNPLSRNSEFRLIAGYEFEVGSEFTATMQYNLEHKLDYTDYMESLPSGALKDDENRHLITLRLTKLLLQQNLTLSLFDFYSPSDEDGYLRFNAFYKLTDYVKVSTGANIFYGSRDHTFFGQLEKNSNVFAALRYEF